MLAIGIDIGTTSLSAAVADTISQTVVSTKTVPHNGFLDTGNPWEKVQDPDALVGKGREMLDEYLAAFPGICAIGLTGQMHGILYTDVDGRAVSPLYTWQDERGNLPLSFGEGMSPSLVSQIREKTGLLAASGFGLVTHLYQEMHGLVPEKAVSLCTIPDYLGMALTGRKTPLLHASMAASLGFFDTQKRDFCREAFAAMGGSEKWLPEFCNTIEVLGTYRGLPVTLAIGDNQASFLGSAGLQEDAVQINIGTGSQISVLSHIFFEAEGIEARPLTEGTYILTGASLCGGRAWAVLEQFFRNYLLAACGAAGTVGAADGVCGTAAGFEAGPQYELLERLAREGCAAASAGAQMPVVDTRFQGTRQDPKLRGSILQLSEENFTPGALAYGVLEGMARELYELFCLITEGIGIRAKRIVASGNGIRKNKVLQEIVSRMFDTPLELSAYQEEAACGAAFAAARSVGD